MVSAKNAQVYFKQLPAKRGRACVSLLRELKTRGTVALTRNFSAQVFPFMDLTEAKTRALLINPLLERAGWDLSDRRIAVLRTCFRSLVFRPLHERGGASGLAEPLPGFLSGRGDVDVAAARKSTNTSPPQPAPNGSNASTKPACRPVRSTRSIAYSPIRKCGILGSSRA
jgi:hypothetical protein